MEREGVDEEIHSRLVVHGEWRRRSPLRPDGVPRPLGLGFAKGAAFDFFSLGPSTKLFLQRFYPAGDWLVETRTDLSN